MERTLNNSEELNVDNKDVELQEYNRIIRSVKGKLGSILSVIQD